MSDLILDAFYTHRASLSRTRDTGTILPQLVQIEALTAQVVRYRVKDAGRLAGRPGTMPRSEFVERYEEAV